MTFEMEDAVEILDRTPGVLSLLLRDVAAEWTKGEEPKVEDWSPFDVVGHLIEGEDTDWIPRTRIILEHGPSKPFTPFDRSAMFEKSKGTTLAGLLDTFAHRRRENLRTLRDLRLTPEKLELEGTHPELGLVTLEQLVATWTVHDLNHIEQIVQWMAARYRDVVGPWRAYLPILEH